MIPRLRNTAVLILLLALPMAAPPGASALDPSELSARVREQLRSRIEDGGLPLYLRVGDEALQAAWALPRFYAQRGYLPAWIGNEGPTPMADELVGALNRALCEGLTPRHYHAAALRTHSLTKGGLVPFTYTTGLD